MITTYDVQRARRTCGLLCLMTVVCLLTSVVAPAARAQTTHDCLPPNSPDSTAQVLSREAVSLLSEASSSSLRLKHSIPTGSAADVSIVQDNAVCNAAMSAFEARTGKQFPESFVIVRMGQSTPFYLMTRRRDGALGTSYLLDAQFTLLDMIGT